MDPLNIVLLVIAAIVIPQYADYAVSAETSAWMRQVVPAKDYVAANPPLADYLSPKIILTGDKEKWHEKASKI